MPIASISVHESAHAIAGWALGTPAARLTLHPPYCSYVDGASLMWRGAVTAKPPRTDRAIWRAAGIRSLAGVVAEARFTGMSLRTLLGRSGSDRAMAMAFADGLAVGGDRNAVLDELLAATSGLVRTHWDTILRLARALEISRELDGFEIARIIARSQAAA